MRRFSGEKPEKKNTSGKSTTGKSGKPYKKDNDRPWRSEKPSSKRPEPGRTSESSDRPFRSNDASKDSWRNKERSSDNSWRNKERNSDNSWKKNKDTDDSAEKPKRTFDKPWQKERRSDERPARKDFAERKPYRSDDTSSESKPWKKRDDYTGKPRERREGNSDKPWKNRTDNTEKPWKSKTENTERPWKGKTENTEKPWRGKSDRIDRPWKTRDESTDTPRQKSEERTDKPWANKRNEGESGWKRKERSFDKPESSERKGGSRYDRSDSASEKRPYKSDWKDKPRDNERSRKTEGYRGRNEKSDTGRSYKQTPSGSFKAGLITDEPVRLNKYIANAGICSRREADEMILAGAVTVNGIVVTELGTKVTRDDKVQFGGDTLTPQNKVYLLLNKPKGVITTVDDPLERNTVMTLVKNACEERIYPVGRLDRNTSGLLLMTNDGDLAKKLTHPSHRVRKIYHVEVNKAFAKSDMTTLAEGIELEDGLMAVDEIAYTGNGDDKKSLGVIIHSGKNRIVRRLFEALGYEVTKLDRVAFANLTKKDLPRGKWRFLEESEINVLKMI